MSARLAAAVFAVDPSLAQSIDRARLAERLGYESIWVTQIPDGRDSALVLGGYASGTTRIGLGAGILPIYSRHPVAMAQAAATLNEFSGGRFRLGLGVSHRVTVEGMWGLRLRHPVRAMREYITIVRALLTAGAVDFTGEYFAARSSYGGPLRPNLPILIAALGPRMLQLAGELADGVVLWMCSPGYIRTHVVPNIRLGRERAGYGMKGFDITIPVPVSLTTVPDAGRASFRSTVAMYSKLPYYRRMLDASGFGGELTAGQISDSMLSELGGIGSEKVVCDTIRRFRDAGCTLPAVLPLRGYRGEAGFEATLECAIDCGPDAT
jgi:F420-dependent oxidoreductase-like protein